jgi:hypothetical protein
MALTATASEKVRDDILKNLKLNRTMKIRKRDNVQPCKIFIASFDRPNLSWQVVKKEVPGVEKEALDQLLELCSEPRFSNKCGIVYCRTREDTEIASQFLHSAGIPSCHYHAGVTPGGKKWVQQKWMSNDIRVVCATIAFGMGIDKSDVRYVIHMSPGECYEMIVLTTIKYLYYQTYIYQLLVDSLSTFLLILEQVSVTDCFDHHQIFILSNLHRLTSHRLSFYFFTGTSDKHQRVLPGDG